MLLAAKALLRDAAAVLTRALATQPDYALVLCGHSLGGGAALLASILLLSDIGSLPIALTAAQRARLRCYACGAGVVGVLALVDLRTRARAALARRQCLAR